LAFDL